MLYTEAVLDFLMTDEEENMHLVHERWMYENGDLETRVLMEREVELMFTADEAANL